MASRQLHGRVGLCVGPPFIRAPLVCWGVSNQGRQAADGMTMANWHRVVGTRKQTAAFFILLFLILSSWIAVWVEHHTASLEREEGKVAWIVTRREISSFNASSIDIDNEICILNQAYVTHFGDSLSTSCCICMSRLTEFNSPPCTNFFMWCCKEYS